MNRLTPFLLLFALFAHHIAPSAVPTEVACSEGGDGCCVPDGACKQTCAVCVCCPEKAPNLIAVVVAEPVLCAPVLVIAAVLESEPQPRPEDILHVPKSSQSS